MIDLTNLSPVPEKPSYEQLSVQLLDAAIELSQIERGEISAGPTIGTVLSNLGLRDHTLATGDDLRKAVDPRTIDIYGRVVSQLTSHSTRNIHDLAAHIKQFSTFDAFHHTPDQLAAMRTFFLALHRELLAENYNRLDDDAPDRV